MEGSLAVEIWRLREDNPRATAKELHAALTRKPEWAELTVSQVKRASSKMSKAKAKDTASEISYGDAVRFDDMIVNQREAYLWAAQAALHMELDMRQRVGSATDKALYITCRSVVSWRKL